MFLFFLSTLLLANCLTRGSTIEILDLDIIPYEKIVQGDLKALQILDKSLHDKGIVGIQGIPGYKKAMSLKAC